MKCQNRENVGGILVKCTGNRNIFGVIIADIDGYAKLLRDVQIATVEILNISLWNISLRGV